MASVLVQGKCWFARLGITFVVLVMSTGMAWAQGGGDTDDEPQFPIDPADLATDAGQWLQQGLTFYAQENYPAASLLFYRVVTDYEASDALIFRAEYELGKTLFRMRYYYGALFYFDGVVTYGPDHPYFIYTYPWLLRLVRRLPGDPGQLQRLAHFSDFFPDQIDDKYRDQVAYLIGRYHYSRGELVEAEQFFSYVSSASRWFGQAQYLLGITRIQQFEGQAAVDAFSSVIQWVLDAEEQPDELRRLGELGVLSMARTLYSTHDYARAIAYYDQVPTSSRYWLDALFEKAWALFQMGEYNLALGNLHSLNSPFFDDEFFPEARILQAVIFFRNCNFDAVRETVEEFRLSYDPLLDQLEEIVSTTLDEEYFDLILALRGEQERDFSPQMQQILNTALSDRTVRESLDFVIEMDRELRAVQQADRGWLETGLADDVLTETGLARSLGAAEAAENARIRIRRARDELQNLVAQSEALLVETDLAEHAVISDALLGELNLSDAGVMPPPVNSEHILWHFNGEYWRDELGYYWYAIRSRCADLGL